MTQKRKEAVKEAIFQLVHKGWSGSAREHPDYFAIGRIVDELPEGSADEFYTHLITGGYGNSAGFYSVRDVGLAMRIFREELSERFFEENGLKEKIASLKAKILGLREAMEKSGAGISPAEQAERIRPEEVMFSKAGKRIRLFTGEELEIMGEDFSRLVQVLGSEGSVRLEEDIRELAKRWALAKMGFAPRSGPALPSSKRGATVRIGPGEKEGAKKVLSLLGPDARVTKF